MTNITVISLFPDMFPGPLGTSITGRALEKNLWSLQAVNPRDFATDIHKTVDDTPAGGGAGMVMKADVLEAAFLSIPQAGRRIYLSPRGRRFDQTVARELAAEPALTLLCGRYEGVDQRFLDAYDFEEISMGDFVVTGGELPAMLLIDAVIRLLPDVVGKADSIVHESHSRPGYLEHPHYTKPAQWTDAQGRVWDIPAVLLSGHHAQIAQWRDDNSRS